ncbi:MAG: hypothetical protein JHC31_02915 [Sulfurihydrogenibium sp.]|jgi:hypothetical protein|nr:hypothetical protein [Sulfurihydrogenibium sp.]
MNTNYAILEPMENAQYPKGFDIIQCLRDYQTGVVYFKLHQNGYSISVNDTDDSVILALNELVTYANSIGLKLIKEDERIQQAKMLTLDEVFDCHRGEYWEYAYFQAFGDQNQSSFRSSLANLKTKYKSFLPKDSADSVANLINNQYRYFLKFNTFFNI